MTTSALHSVRSTVLFYTCGCSFIVIYMLVCVCVMSVLRLSLFVRIHLSLAICPHACTFLPYEKCYDLRRNENVLCAGPPAMMMMCHYTVVARATTRAYLDVCPEYILVHVYSPIISAALLSGNVLYTHARTFRSTR